MVFHLYHICFCGFLPCVLVNHTAISPPELYYSAFTSLTNKFINYSLCCIFLMNCKAMKLCGANSDWRGFGPLEAEGWSWVSLVSPTECGHTLDVSGSGPRGEFLADGTMGFCRSSVFSGSRVLVHSIRVSRCSVSGAFPPLPSLLLFHQPGSNPAWDVCATYCLPLHTLSPDIGVEELEGCSSTSEHSVVSGHIKDLLLYSVRRWCALLFFDKLFRKQFKITYKCCHFVFQFLFGC